MDNTTVYSRLARLVEAFKRCQQSGNEEWEHKHGEEINKIVGKIGVGQDFNMSVEESSDERLVFYWDNYECGQYGMHLGYSTWTAYVTPSLGYDIKIHVKLERAPEELLEDEFWIEHSEDYFIEGLAHELGRYV